MKLLRISIAFAVLTVTLAWHGSVEASTLDRLIGYAPGQYAAYQSIAKNPQVSYDPGALATAWSLYNKAIQAAQNKQSSAALQGPNVRIGQTAALSSGSTSSRNASYSRNGTQRTASLQSPAASHYPQPTRLGGVDDPANQIAQQRYVPAPTQQYQYAQNYYQQPARQGYYQTNPYNYYGNQYYGGQQYYGNQGYYGGGYYPQQNCGGST